MNWAHRLCQETARESICSVNMLRQKSLVNQSKSSTHMRIGNDLRAKMLLGKKKAIDLTIFQLRVASEKHNNLLI